MKRRSEKIDITKQEIRIVMSLVAEYPQIKFRTQYFPLRRPLFMQRLKVDIKDWEKNGMIQYDRTHAALLHEDDQRFIYQYEHDMFNLFLIQHGIASIQNQRTYAIGVKTLLEGIKCKQLTQDFHLCISSIYWERDKARRIIAVFIRKMKGSNNYEKDC